MHWNVAAVAIRAPYPVLVCPRSTPSIRRLSACVAAVSLCAFLITGGMQALQALAASGPRSGAYEMRRSRQLHVKMVVRHHRLIYIQVQAVFRCAGGGTQFGLGITIHEKGGIQKSGRYGRFYYHQQAEEEGEGLGELTLRGRIKGNKAIGTFRDWEEPEYEEPESGGFGPRCGTAEPKGRVMHFTARRTVIRQRPTSRTRPGSQQSTGRRSTDPSR